MFRAKGVVTVFVLLFLGIFAHGCGGDDSSSREQLEAARAEGAQEAREQAQLKRLQDQVKELQQNAGQGTGQNPQSGKVDQESGDASQSGSANQGNGSGAQGGAPRNGGSPNGNPGPSDGYYEESVSNGPDSSCGNGVRIGSNTSCAFAMNVAGEYGSNPGATTINAFSPVTGEHYKMSCSPWKQGTVCVGGRGSAVFLP